MQNESIDLWKTDQEILEILGSRFRAQRLKMNLTQAELAKEVGVSLGTMQNFESAKSAKLETFVKVLRFFSELDKLDSILDLNELSPREQFEARNEEPRQRARKND